MPTRFVKGDLFRWPGLKALAHGCNCAGAMGKGIAVEFRQRFPRMYAEYKERCADGRFRPGDVFTWTEDGVTVFNLGTQKTWRTKAELPAIEAAVTRMVRAAEQLGIPRIGLPRIGAGLGGLLWEPIRAMLERIGETTQVELLVFEEFLPASTESEGAG
ncbi:macro domain-containing protein [Pyxidicoccus fallax]|uniref:Macro domain-containing protein n=1 Tax=Pyxidicoccus fallax TaxID=394095 RepID=A0A848LDD4_9BACT|nr:macro domain-containing protein [Pyxidicoccus fallax]NMO17019.1 macro domain-containing protein [Pyxidicoccus fallax]NPC79430.1 macro domain-containing protein [Pyxidicoccus fallax]